MRAGTRIAGESVTYGMRERPGLGLPTIGLTASIGHGGSGPAQLALAILLDVTGDAEVAQDNYQDFKRQFVAGWGDKWEVTESQVREWLSMSSTQAEGS